MPVLNKANILNHLAWVLWIVMTGNLFTETVTWDGGAHTNNWSDAENWNPNRVPADSDNVSIDVSGIIQIGPNTSAKVLTLSLGGTNLTVLVVGGNMVNPLRIYQTSGISLTVNNNSTLRIINTNGIKFGPTGDNYDQALTFLASGSKVEYAAGLIPVDTYGGLAINTNSGVTLKTKGAGTIIVDGQINKYGAGTFKALNPFLCNIGYLNNNGIAEFTEGLTVNGSGVSSQGFFMFGGIITGTITVNCPITKIHHGSCGGTVTYAGSSQQTIRLDTQQIPGISPVNVGAFNNLTINNSQGLILNYPIQVNGILSLKNGLITTTSINHITLTGDVTVLGSNSYIYGPCTRIVTPGKNEIFPIGKHYYRPVMTNLSGISPVVHFEVFDAPPVQSWISPLVLISNVRYWQGTIDSGMVNGGTVELQYGPDDGVRAPKDLRLAYSSDERHSSYRSLFEIEESLVSLPKSNAVEINSNLHEGITEWWPNLSGIVGGILANDSLGYFTLGSETFNNLLPLDLISFTGKVVSGKVMLNWQLASEVNISGYEIYRSENEHDAFQLLNKKLIAGQEDKNISHSYGFVDSNVEEDKIYYYRLYSLDINGRLKDYGAASITTIQTFPTEFRLNQNYPNPFNSVTRISFIVGEQDKISLGIYNTLGQKVRTLINEENFQPGPYHDVVWDAKNEIGELVTSGIYYLILTAQNHSIRQVRKITLLK